MITHFGSLPRKMHHSKTVYYTNSMSCKINNWKDSLLVIGRSHYTIKSNGKYFSLSGDSIFDVSSWQK